MLTQEDAEWSPFIDAAQQALEFENEEHLDVTGSDLTLQRRDAGPVKMCPGIGCIGVTGDFEPALRSATSNIVSTDCFLACAGIKAAAYLTYGRNTCIDRNGNGRDMGR